MFLALPQDFFMIAFSSDGIVGVLKLVVIEKRELNWVTMSKKGFLWTL